MAQLTNMRPQPGEQLDAIAPQVRRRLLVALLDGGQRGETPVEIAELLDGTESREASIRMRHVHLPKLEDYGFVRWDREEDLVARGPQFGEIQPLLTLLCEHGDGLCGEWL